MKKQLSQYKTLLDSGTKAPTMQSPVVSPSVVGFKNRMVTDDTPLQPDPLPPMNLFEKDYKPSKTATESVLTLKLKFGPDIVSWCSNRAKNIEEKGAKYKMSLDEIFAILVYTFDIGLAGKREENLYYQLNLMMRNRDKDQMILWRDYIFYLMNGLFKLPVHQGKVARGIDVQVSASKYSKGKTVVWNAFTSTSASQKVAQGFIQQSGILFIMDVTSGRSISEFSAIPNEDEILILPNSEWAVSFVLDTQPQIFHLEQKTTSQPILPDPKVGGGSVFLKSVEKVKLLGKGNFGEVWLGNWNSVTVAMKSFTATTEQQQEKEIANLMSCRHPNVVHYYGLFQTSDSKSPLMVMEFVELGSLKSFLEEHEDELNPTHLLWI